MEVSVVKHVVRPGQLVAGLITHNNFVAVYLVLKKYELAAHTRLQEGLRDVADSPRAVLPASSVHMIPKAHANSAGERLRSKELVEGLGVLCLAAHGAWFGALPHFARYIALSSLLFVPSLCWGWDFAFANSWGRRQLACQSLAVYDKGSVYYTLWYTPSNRPAARLRARQNV